MPLKSINHGLLSLVGRQSNLEERKTNDSKTGPEVTEAI